MVDVIKSLGIEYCAANPGSSFRGLHESFINYGGNTNPELLTCCHEESSVAMAHGYAKIEGKPHDGHGPRHRRSAARLDGDLQRLLRPRARLHCARQYLRRSNYRRGTVEWVHSVQDAAAMVRDYTKWDDTPVSLTHFAESAVRAYKISMTPPYEPVVLVADGDSAGRAHPNEDHEALRIPKLADERAAARRFRAVAEAAKLLVAAENPVIVADRAARTPAGMKLLVELAETLQAPGRSIKADA